MNRHSYHQQQQQQQQPYSVSDINKGLVSLNLDSNTLKKLTVSGIREFVPQPSQGGSQSSSSGRFPSGNSSGSGYRLPNNPTSSGAPPYSSSSFSSDRLSNTSLSTPPPSMLANSPRQSPTPSSVGMLNPAAASATPDASGNIAIYSDGGTTYFYPGDEMVGCC